VAIRHRGAQGSGVQDCIIDATHGYCGLEGGCGSGGSHINVAVIGGRIGADLRQTQPAPTITGFTLINQTETALICSSRQALCVVGLHIETETSGPVIVTRKQWGAHHGQLCLVDSQINFHKPGNNTAIEAASSLYIDNVYIHGAQTLIKQPNKPPLRCKGPGWTHIRQYAGGVEERYRARKYGNRIFDYPAPIFVDGKRLNVSFLADVASSQLPPANLQSRHVWNDQFPNWESHGAVNVKDEPYGAVGDGTTDDADSIQRAVDDNLIVFLPKGRYAVSKTIRLRPDTKLIGLHRCYSWLVPLSRPGGDFDEPKNPRPVVRTANDVKAETALAFLGIRTMKPSEAAGLYNYPLVVIDGHGGGRWYNFHQESSRGHGHNYRHLLIDGTSEPLHMYQCNPEHARSDANMELRNARNVSIYGVKGEYNQPIIWIRDCDHIRVLGCGGNAAAHEGHALFVIERTPNFLLANLVDSPRMPQGIPNIFFAGDGVDPRHWHMVLERTPAGNTILTQPLDRPVLYKRGLTASKLRQ